MLTKQFAKIVFLSSMASGQLCFAEEGIPFDPNVPNGSDSWAQAPDSLKPLPSASPAAVAEIPKENTAPAVPVPVTKQEATKSEIVKTKMPPPAELSGLGNLAPFSDIAVISRRFLPKTKRFEIFPNLGMVLNDAFFNDVIYGGRLAYYFSEHYAFEATGLVISTSTKAVTDELQNIRNIATASLATPRSYAGLDFKWVPIYGKIGWMNKRIVPFDLYLSGGGGVTTTNQSTTPATIHLGVGQIFAISKWMAGRWDISWYAYNSSTTVTNRGTGTYSNLHATFGLSFFFPPAEYR